MNTIICIDMFYNVLQYLSIKEISKIYISSSNYYRIYKSQLQFENQLIDSHFVKTHKIIIPPEIINTFQLLRWITIYKKTLRYYNVKLITNNKIILYTKNPVSIYEILAKILNYKDYDNKYKKMPKTKLLHEKNKYGYTFHGLSSNEMSIFTYEMSIVY